jgi:hypothetical protein
MSRLPLALLADAPHSQPVKHGADLAGWVIGLLLVIGLLYWLMWQGWKWRATLQSGLPPLPAIPQEEAQPLLELEGRYAGSTTAGQWLDRIVARDLGVRSLAELTLTEEGLRVVRPASADFYVPVAALRGARTDKGIAGKVLPEGGLLVVTWEHGGKLIDSGFRGDHPADHPDWVKAIEDLIARHSSGGEEHDKEGAE